MIVHNSVLRTVIHVKRCAFALLMTFVSAPSWAQPCDAQNQKLFTPASFVQENQYAGKIAHRPFGKSSAFIEIIENCAVIARKPELEFVIGNAVEAHNDLEKNVGVFVQVVRFQYRDQADRITLFRLQGWLRDGRSLGIIDDQPLRGVTPTEFFEIHDGISFNNPVDGKIQIDGTKWHASLMGEFTRLSVSGRQSHHPMCANTQATKPQFTPTACIVFSLIPGGKKGCRSPFEQTAQSAFSFGRYRQIVQRSAEPLRSSLHPRQDGFVHSAAS